MIQAALFSHFPAQFLVGIIAKLKLHDIEIGDRIYDANRNSPNLYGCDGVLFMHEMASHGELARVKKIAEDHRLPLVMLPKQAAKWPTLFKPLAKTGASVERKPAPSRPRLVKGIRNAVPVNIDDPAFDMSAPEHLLKGEVPPPVPPPPPSAAAPKAEMKADPDTTAAAVEALPDGDQKELLKLYESENLKLATENIELKNENKKLKTDARLIEALNVLRDYFAHAMSHAQAAE